MIIDRGSLALNKQKSYSMLTRLILTAAAGLFTYGILWSWYNNNFIQLALLMSSFGILMIAVSLKKEWTHISKDK